MSINPMRWKARTVLYTSLGLLLFYMLVFYKKTHHVMNETTLYNTNPMHVWEFVADFSNMKKLNPTIEDFNIVAESGNYEHWRYSVRYTEHLSHLPMIRNVAHAHFAVRRDKNDYIINSKHNTCFYENYGCLESVSQFRFEKDGTNDTRCLETVQYECPIIFSFFCYKEVMYQRTEIMKRLKLIFSPDVNIS